MRHGHLDPLRLVERFGQHEIGFGIGLVQRHEFLQRLDGEGVPLGDELDEPLLVPGVLQGRIDFRRFPESVVGLVPLPRLEMQLADPVVGHGRVRGIGLHGQGLPVVGDRQPPDVLSLVYVAQPLHVQRILRVDAAGPGEEYHGALQIFLRDGELSLRVEEPRIFFLGTLQAFLDRLLRCLELSFFDLQQAQFEPGVVVLLLLVD